MTNRKLTIYTSYFIKSKRKNNKKNLFLHKFFAKMEENNFISFLNGNIWFNCTTFTLAITGILASIYLYNKSKKKKLPTYILRTISLIADKIENIESIHIEYHGQEIRNLAITKLALWNDGNDTINTNDFAQNGPLKITINNDFQILDCKLIYQKQPKNNFDLILSEDKKNIYINFEYFSHLEGVIILIYHTGRSNSNITLEGQIKSNQKINRKTTKLLPNVFDFLLKIGRRKHVKKIIGCCMLLIGLSTAINVICLYFTGHELIIVEPNQYKDPLYLFLIIFLIITSLLYIYMGYKLLKKRIPKGFDIFDDEF